MLERVGRLVVRRRVAVLVASGVLVVLAALVGANVVSRLTSGGFEDPGAESTEAARVLSERYGAERTNVLLLVTAKDGTVDSPAVVAAGNALTEELGRQGVTGVASYWSLGEAPPLKSRDATKAVIVGSIPGDDTQVQERIKALSPQFTRDTADVKVGVGGFAEVYREMNHQIESDLIRAELIAAPITLILLLFVFRSAIAAFLPLAVGVIAVIGTMFALYVITGVTDVSVYAINLTTAMGLGLAIDYSLFIVSRYREELATGVAPHDAVVRTVATAGKTVLFSAFTVAVSLAALLVFPLYFLRSFAYAGTVVAVIAAAGALFTLPALLAVLGTGVDKWHIGPRRVKPAGEGGWHRVATFVMKRPVPVATAAILALLVLGLPFFGIVFNQADDRALPEGASVREVHQTLRTEFSSNEAAAVQVVLPEAPASTTSQPVDAYATALSRLPGVGRVDAATGIYANGTRVLPAGIATARFPAAGQGTWLSVVPNVEPMSSRGEQVVREVRAQAAPGEALVGGQTAELVDAKNAMFSRLPWALAWIAASTFVLLFLMFGSVLVPVKALVINALSLSATFGALVWIFQEGHLSGPLGFTATGTTETTMPILMFCVAFGLSMDYEVFLLSRIKEEHDRGTPNTEAVALGLERSGRIVTAAALLMSVVFLAFGTSGVTFIKLFGIGLTIAVLMDAFVIRATLVPAFMRLAGDANWWAPKWMRRIYDRFGIHEAEPVPGAGAATEPEQELVNA